MEINGREEERKGWNEGEEKEVRKDVCEQEREVMINERNK